jgi:hypothetical protein
MAEIEAEVTAARTAIRQMLAERPRPTQVRIALATGLTQSRVAKINRCDFGRMSDGVRRVVEYSSMGVTERRAAESRAQRIAERLELAARRLGAHDPALGELIADFVEGVAARRSG